MHGAKSRPGVYTITRSVPHSALRWMTRSDYDWSIFGVRIKKIPLQDHHGNLEGAGKYPINDW